MRSSPGSFGTRYEDADTPSFPPPAQGKGLAVPETVPFRLTQNLVDGFGSSGVEGVFRRCSEETLRVMRTSSNVIMTVLEVFKHDPLQKW